MDASIHGSQLIGRTIRPPEPGEIERFIDLLRCPETDAALKLDQDGAHLAGGNGRRYPLSPDGIALFAEQPQSNEAWQQQAHYDRIAAAYVTNLGYPHTIEYMRYLDDALLAVAPEGSLGACAEICCGHGESFNILGPRMERGVGVDISREMLARARHEHIEPSFLFVQGDATRLPLATGRFDTVFMLGGIHHVNDRAALFAEVFRILKPGGAFIYREPVSDFFLWRAIRAAVYRLSPALDHENERPLLYRETIPVLERSGFKSDHWSTHGFLGFCLFMNSDVLVFNRLFRFLPGIGAITRASTRLDRLVLSIPGLRGAGLQVVGKAVKRGKPC